MVPIIYKEATVPQLIETYKEVRDDMLGLRDSEAQEKLYYITNELLGRGYGIRIEDGKLVVTEL